MIAVCQFEEENSNSDPRGHARGRVQRGSRNRPLPKNQTKARKRKSATFTHRASVATSRPVPRERSERAIVSLSPAYLVVDHLIDESRHDEMNSDDGEGGNQRDDENEQLLLEGRHRGN